MLFDMITEEQVLQIAEAAYEADRHYAKIILDEDKLVWSENTFVHKSVVNGVKFVLNGNTDPEKNHNNWFELRASEGWTLGDNDPANKTSKYLKQWHELPEEIQYKNSLFIEVVRGLALQLGLKSLRNSK